MLYRLDFTEINGEQEYSHTELIAAGSLKEAEQIGRDYIQQWYDDPDAEWLDDDTYEFWGGQIQVRKIGVSETTLKDILRDHLYSLPISKDAINLIDEFIDKLEG